MDIVNPLNQTGFPALSVATGAAAASTSACEPGPELVMVWATAAAYVEIGENPTANAGSTPIPPNVPVFFKVPAGTGAPWKISALQVSAAGTLYAKPCNRIV